MLKQQFERREQGTGEQGIGNREQGKNFNFLVF